MSKLHLYDPATGGAICKRVPDAIADTTLTMLEVTCRWCLRQKKADHYPVATPPEAVGDLLGTYRSPCGAPGHFSNLAGSVIASEPDSGEELYCVNCKLEKEIRLVRGAMAAQDEREQLAGARLGIPWEESGCDWPDAVADAFEALRARLAPAVITYRVEQQLASGGWVPGFTNADRERVENCLNPAYVMRVIEITTMERIVVPANE